MKTLGNFEPHSIPSELYKHATWAATQGPEEGSSESECKTLTFLEVSDYSGLTSTQYLTGEDCGDRDKFKGIFTPRRPGTTYLVRVSSTPI
jgi:hypothetical protein